MVKGYDGEILYHPGKVNVVVNDLSRESTSRPRRELCLRMKTFIPLLDLMKSGRE